MDSRIRTARTEYGSGRISEPAERRLELALNGPLVWLELPSMEFGPVVVEGQHHSDRFGGFHREKVDRFGAMSSDVRVRKIGRKTALRLGFHALAPTQDERDIGLSDRTVDVKLTDLIGTVVDGKDLSAKEAEGAIDLFMAGAASEVEMAGLLVGLRAKGLTPVEVAGGVRALRKAMVPVHSSDPTVLVDTAGTGGGGVTTFNISTAAAIVAAGAGAQIAKHGNRSFTSRSGSADVLEALGVKIDLSATRMGEVLGEAGIVFMFAPLLHPAMRHVGPVRRGLGITTMMNILGPLTNPAGARRQVIGVADPALIDLIAASLRELGHTRGMVVHGAPGMDEISPSGPTEVAQVANGEIVRYTVTPEELGLESASIESLAGGEPAENAEVMLRVLAGAPGGARTAVLVNAAAALWVGEATETLESGVAMAASAIDSGAAQDALNRLRDATNRV